MPFPTPVGQLDVRGCCARVRVLPLSGDAFLSLPVVFFALSCRRALWCPPVPLSSYSPCRRLFWSLVFHPRSPRPCPRVFSLAVSFPLIRSLCRRFLLIPSGPVSWFLASTLLLLPPSFVRPRFALSRSASCGFSVRALLHVVVRSLILLFLGHRLSARALAARPPPRFTVLYHPRCRLSPPPLFSSLGHSSLGVPAGTSGAQPDAPAVRLLGSRPSPLSFLQSTQVFRLLVRCAVASRVTSVCFGAGVFPVPTRLPSSLAFLPTLLLPLLFPPVVPSAPFSRWVPVSPWLLPLSIPFCAAVLFSSLYSPDSLCLLCSGLPSLTFASLVVASLWPSRSFRS